jgi:hypothetical protein
MDALAPPQRAAFATAARLLSCLVTESLTRAVYIPIDIAGSDVKAAAVILSANVSEKPPKEAAAYAVDDLLALVPLKHIPIFKHDSSDARGKEIGLLDPMDMYPIVFVVEREVHGHRVVDMVCPTMLVFESAFTVFPSTPCSSRASSESYPRPGGIFPL